jgi:hypothetical protein
VHERLEDRLDASLVYDTAGLLGQLVAAPGERCRRELDRGRHRHV